MAKQAKETGSEQRSMVPWKPFAEMARWERDMERRFGNLLSGRFQSLFDERSRPGGDMDLQEPAIDMYEEKDQIVVKAEMPGMSKDDIQISVTDNVLTIKGDKQKEEEDRGKDYYRSERAYGAFIRTLPLPAEINAEKVEAIFKNGVLEVRLPKSEAAKKKEIKINVHNGN
jgi:HSP20 family protein